MSTQRISLICPNRPYSNKVSVIKSIRALTGIGLKEAKDACELVGITQSFNLDPKIANLFTEIEDHSRILRSEGIQVGEPIHKLLDDLRELGSQALLQGEDELANEILQLVLAEKLRRQP